MSVDPRKYSFTNKCETEIEKQRTDFFNAGGKIGDLEILNDLGLGGVGQALRTLSSISDSIRTDGSSNTGVTNDDRYTTFLGKILGTARDAVNDGAQTILDSMGLGAAVGAVDRFNPGVANRAWGQAQSLYERIKDGNFQLSDIPSYLQDFQNLEQLARGIYTPAQGSQTNVSAEITVCDPSPYAMDLMPFYPKYKFLFMVEFVWNPVYAEHLKDLQTAFVIKNSTRPKVSVEHEEVNMYNFRTQVPKRTTHDQMSMRFYDDNWNQAMILWDAYHKIISPIANMNFSEVGANASGVFDQSGMDNTSFGTSKAYGVKTHDYSASFGVPADGNTKDAFKQINLFHLYREGRLLNVYQFYNPRLQSFNLDDVDMAEGSEGGEVELMFTYDSVHVTTGYDVSPNNTDNKWNVEDLSGSNRRATYPIVYNGGGVDTNCRKQDLNVAHASSTVTSINEQDDAQDAVNRVASTLVGQGSTIEGQVEYGELEVDGETIDQGDANQAAVQSNQIEGAIASAQTAASKLTNAGFGSWGDTIKRITG